MAGASIAASPGAGGFRGGRNFAGLGGHHGGFHHGGFGHPGYYGGGAPNWGYASGGYYNPGYDGGYGYDGLGFGLAAGLLGGALLAAEAPYVGYDSGRTVGYCETHFKSYNPASGTYLGYDGHRHRCP